MIRTTTWGIAAAWLAIACSGSDPEGPPSNEPPVEVDETSDDEPAACTPASGCTSCGSCAALCVCGGSSAAACEDQCAAAPLDEPPPPPPPEVITEEGRSAVTLVTQEFEVPAGGETFRCQNFDNPFGRHVAVVESRSAMAEGSHHMFVFQGDYQASGLQTCGGLDFGANIHSSQRSEETTVYPDGIGRILFAEEGLRVQAHYLNTTNEPITGYIAVTLEAVEPDEVEAYAAQVFINTLSINVPPQSTGSANAGCTVPTDAQLLSASSHMHQFGTYFQARATDGQLVFETNEWAEPTPWEYDPALSLAAGTRIEIHCDYENTTDETLTFGESAATNEMCILSGLYYPAPNGASITCLL